LPKKRKSGGRSKGGKGKSGLVQCTNCGMSALYRELKSTGAYIAKQDVYKFYCVSCAVHFGVVKVRSRDERRRSG
jgi:small subunit ribosomal protein S26e